MVLVITTWCYFTYSLVSWCTVCLPPARNEFHASEFLPTFFCCVPRARGRACQSNKHLVSANEWVNTWMKASSLSDLLNLYLISAPDSFLYSRYQTQHLLFSNCLISVCWLIEWVNDVHLQKGPAVVSRHRSHLCWWSKYPKGTLSHWGQAPVV